MDSQFTELQKHIDALFKSADEAYDRVASAQGISSSTMDILYALLVYGEGLTQKQICDYSYNNKQTINSAIHKLEKQGMLSVGAGEGRATRIHLTEEGRRFASRTVLPVVDAEKKAIGAIPEEQRALFFHILDAYATTLTTSLDTVARNARNRKGA